MVKKVFNLSRLEYCIERNNFVMCSLLKLETNNNLEKFNAEIRIIFIN